MAPSTTKWKQLILGILLVMAASMFLACCRWYSVEMFGAVREYLPLPAGAEVQVEAELIQRAVEGGLTTERAGQTEGPDSETPGPTAADAEMTETPKNEDMVPNDVRRGGIVNKDVKTLHKQRRDLVHKVCKQSNPSLVLKNMDDYSWPTFPRGQKTARTDGPFFNTMILSESTKFFLCQINKAGMRASLEFFRMGNKSPLKDYSTYERYDSIPQSEKMSNYHRIKLIPLQTILDKFGGFTKMIVVRHPLQRYVSAYYEIMHLGKTHSRGIESFSQFIQDRILNDEWHNFHWSRYQDACHPCMVDYDYIFRTESLDDEFPWVSGDMGFGAGTEYVHNHLNPTFEGNSSSQYRYDDTLAKLEKEEPELFQRLLEIAAVDMEMFGYTWENHRSGCSMGSGGYC